MAMVQVESYNFSTVENPLSNGGNFTIISDTNFTTSLKVAVANICEPTTTGAIGGAFWASSYSPLPVMRGLLTNISEITIANNFAGSFAYLVCRKSRWV